MISFKKILAACSVVGMLLLPTNVAAGNNKPCTACDVVEKLIKQAPYKGPIRPASEPMACARILGRTKMPVVWINGNKDNYVTAPVIKGVAVVYTEPFAMGKGWVVTESCIPRRLLRGVPKLVLCTGQEVGKGFHWALTDRELAEMKKTGHFTSYVPFMTVADRKSFDHKVVVDLYKKRYRH